MNTKTQRAAIKKHLLSGRAITALDALRKFDSLRLGARIWELKQDGMPIITTMVKIGEKRVARYSLAS